MTKRQTFSLMARIAVYYAKFEIDQQMVDSWHEILKDYDLERLEKALDAHVSTSVYPPKIADLLRKPPATRIIPSPKETIMLITGQKRPASREVVEKELAKMRKILNIKREKPQ